MTTRCWSLAIVFLAGVAAGEPCELPQADVEAGQLIQAQFTYKQLSKKDQEFFRISFAKHRKNHRLSEGKKFYNDAWIGFPPLNDKIRTMYVYTANKEECSGIHCNAYAVYENKNGVEFVYGGLLNQPRQLIITDLKDHGWRRILFLKAYGPYEVKCFNETKQSYLSAEDKNNLKLPEWYNPKEIFGE